jgi:hypothetical protein
MKQVLFLALSILGIAAIQDMNAGTKAWTVWDQYERTPVVGHDNGKLSFKCKLCGWEKEFTWDEHFWENADEAILMEHLEAFHGDDIKIKEVMDTDSVLLYLSKPLIVNRVGFPPSVHRISIYGGDDDRLVAYADSNGFTGKFLWTVIDTSETLKTLFKDLERRF